MVLNSVVARGHTDSVSSLSLSDHLLASGGDDRNVYLWSLDQSPFPVHHIPRSDPCSAVKFDLDKPDVLYTAHGTLINTWDLRNLSEPLCEWKVNDDEINTLDVLKGEFRLAASDDSGAVQILDTVNGEVVRTLKKHDNICSVAKFRPSRTWQLISGGLDCRVIVSDWKGSGLGVIIFELDEIIDADLFEAAGDSLPLPTRSSSGSHASTSEYADIGYGELEEVEDTDADEQGDLQIPSDRIATRSPDPNSVLASEVDPSGAESPDNQSPDSTDSPATTVAAHEAWSSGLPINPPMVHSLACSASGDFVAVGLEKSTIELFAGDGKRLSHAESLFGHRRAVSAVHFIGDTHLISGGNDYCLFLWTLGSEIDGQQVLHDAKINAIEGIELQKIYVADYSPVIRLLDLSVC